MLIKKYDRISYKELEARLKQGATPSDLAMSVVMGSAAPLHVVKADDEEETEDRTRLFRMSSESVDRDNDTIALAGWELERYNLNGAFLFAHKSRELPIAKPGKAFIQGAFLMAPATFPTKDVHPFGAMLLQLVDAGILVNTSVGFIPKEWIFNQERGGFDFVRQELVENSLTPVGSNPDAMLDTAAQKGIDLAPMLDWAGKFLDKDEEAYTLGVDELIVKGIHASLKDWRPATDPGRAPVSATDPAPVKSPKAAKDAEWDRASEIKAATAEDIEAMEAPGTLVVHHRAAGDHAVVWAGVKDAMRDAIESADLSKEKRKEAYDHLAAHYAEFGEEPPAFKSADAVTADPPDTEQAIDVSKMDANELAELKTAIDTRLKELNPEEPIDVRAEMERHIKQAMIDYTAPTETKEVPDTDAMRVAIAEATAEALPKFQEDLRRLQGRLPD